MSPSSAPPVLGIDLGGTKILAAVIDAAGRILGRAKRPTPSKEGGDAILRAMADGVEEALGEANLKAAELAGAAIGSPGPLDTERGIILFSSNLAVKDYPIGPELAKVIGRPVLVQNDVRAGGYGEYRLGAGKGHQSMLAAFVGTGIGGCVVIDGKVLEGATGNAGEIGHIPLKNKGPECGCGRRGCMEAFASRTAIARRIRKALKAGTATPGAEQLVGKSGDRIKSRELAAAYEADDPIVVREVHRAAHYLGRGLGGLVNVLGPEIVVIGGGVAEALGAPYLHLIRAAAREQILVDPQHKIRFELAALGDDAGILGAALMARERFAAAT